MRHEPEYLPETAAQSSKDAAEMSVFADQIKSAFAILHLKWLGSSRRGEMKSEMEAVARALGYTICPDCLCELVKAGGECEMCGWRHECDRPPEPDFTDNLP